MNKQVKTKLIGILIVAFLLRLAYVIYGFVIKQNAFFLNGDSFSYTGAIINLLHNGVYTFDVSHSDASFGRLPGYPFFWGLHYLLFKQNAYLAVAVTQSIIDSLVCLFLFHLVLSFTKHYRIGLLASFLYAVNVFAIAWVPITGTETMGVFCSVFLVYTLSKQKHDNIFWFILIGLLSAAALYVREYLGIFFPIIASYLWVLFFRKKVKVFSVLIFVASFLSLYIFWPIRNYVSFHRIELLKPRSAGYAAFGKDFAAFREWMYAWNTDVQPYLNNMLENKNPGFPHSIFINENEEHFAITLSKKAVSCGESFQAWKSMKLLGTPTRQTQFCNQEIIRGFDSLKKIFIKQHSLIYYLKVPGQNLGKALFKHSLTKGNPITSSPFVLFVFMFRSLLVILGFMGLFFLPRNIACFTIIAFTIFMYLYIPVYIRQVEMRYLLQADVLLLIPACVCIEKIVKRFRSFQAEH